MVSTTICIMQFTVHRFSFIFLLAVLTLSITNPAFKFVDAQQASLSVSAAGIGKFFGPQIVMITIEGSGVAERDTSPGALVVNGVNVPLVHLTNSGWYAFVADQDTFTTLADVANFPGEQVSALGGSFWSIGAVEKSLLFPTLPGAFGHDPPNSSLNPNLDLDGDCAAAVTDQDACVEWPYIRLFSFNENDRVSFRYSSQSVTLDYINPSLSDISISLDRNSYPVGAEIILTLADYMWNINPMEEDRVHFAFTGSGSDVFYQASPALAPASLAGVLNNLEFDNKQILGGEGLDGIKFANTISGMQETVLVETVPNSGIFENFDNSSDRADMTANKRDAQIRFDYFDISTSSGMSTSDASVSVGKEEPKVSTEKPKVEEPKVEEPKATVEPYTISEPDLVDLSGSRIDGVAIGQPLVVQSRVTNNFDAEQPIIYILQIKDNDGFTVMLTWIKGTVNASSALDAGISWTPEEKGTYSVEIFVWKSLEDPGLPLTKSTIVSVGE
jgi:hypothetical protein